LHVVLSFLWNRCDSEEGGLFHASGLMSHLFVIRSRLVESIMRHIMLLQEEDNMRRVTRCSQSLLFTFLLISVLTFPVVAAPAPVRLAALDTDRYTHAVDQAIGWIKGQQEADGSFPTEWGHAAGMTLDAVFAGVAAGEDVSEWRAGVGDPSAVEYLESVVNEYAVDAGRTGKLVAGIVAAGEDPEAFGGVGARTW